jgi:hypothetical protein
LSWTNAVTPHGLTTLLLCAAAVFAATDACGVESRAEIQINLCSDPTRVVSALALAAERKPTTIFLFDSPTLDLNRAGLRLRLREHDKESELTLKVAGQNCEQVSPALLKPDGKCEADLHGDALDDVISLSRRLDAPARARLLAPDETRGAPLVAALTAALEPRQRTLLTERRSATGGTALLPADVARLGPSSVRTYRSPNASYVVEVWTLPGGQQFVELSEKTRRSAALARSAELTRVLNTAGLAICRDQDSQAKNKLAILAR